jgi:hypothetical protein
VTSRTLVPPNILELTDVEIIQRAYGTDGLENEIRQGMTDIVQVLGIDYVPCGLLQQS